MLLLLSFVLTLAVTSGCSNVAMPKNDLAVVHARTMDLGSWTDFEFITYPPTESTLGYLGVYPTSRHFDSIGIRHGIAAGMNTEGLSCDMQTLLKTSYPPKPGEDDDREGVMVGFFCDWVLKAFSTVDEVSSALDVGGTHSVYGPNNSLSTSSYVMRPDPRLSSSSWTSPPRSGLIRTTASLPTLAS